MQLVTRIRPTTRKRAAKDANGTRERQIALNGARAIDMMLRHSDIAELSRMVGSGDIVARMAALIMAARKLTP